MTSSEVKTNIESPSNALKRVEKYIESGRDVQFSSINGVSFLMYLCAILDEETSIKVIEKCKNIDINEPWDYKQTPLHICAQMDLLDLAIVLINNKCDIFYTKNINKN